MMMMCDTLVHIPTMRAQAMERGSTVYTLRERKRKNATWEGEAEKVQSIQAWASQEITFMSPDLLPGHHRSFSEDEDDGDNVEGSPHKERQHPSTAPHGSEPGQADQQDGAQRKHHAHHRQSGDVDVDVLHRDTP